MPFITDCVQPYSAFFYILNILFMQFIPYKVASNRKKMENTALEVDYCHLHDTKNLPSDNGGDVW
jgi:hypothetical protein